MKHTHVSQADSASLQPAKKKRSMAAEVWMRLCRNKMAMIGLAILLVLVFCAIFANQLADYETLVIKQDMSIRLQDLSGGRPGLGEHLPGGGRTVRRTGRLLRRHH